MPTSHCKTRIWRCRPRGCSSAPLCWCHSRKSCPIGSSRDAALHRRRRRYQTPEPSGRPTWAEQGTPFKPKTTVWLGGRPVAISSLNSKNGSRERPVEMSSVTDELRLAADFAPATYEDWRKLVDGVLKGAPFEKLVGKTYDGLKIEPIYQRARDAVPIAGRPAAAPWQIMQRIDHPDAAMANVQALHDLENGATGLEIEFTGGPGARGFGVSDATKETL